MNPDDKKRVNNSYRSDADHLHIQPEYGEQGEGPGEQGVRRASTQPQSSSRPLNNNLNSTRSIKITDVSEANLRAKSPSTPRFSHGEEDVMQYFEVKSTTTMPEKTSPRSSSHASASPQTPASRAPLASTLPPRPSSSTSSNNQPPHHSAPATAKPHKKFNLAAALTIIFVTILITATAVFALLFFTQNNQTENKITVVENINVEETSSITCKKNGDDEQRKAAGDATKMSTTIIVNYLDGNLENYSENTVYDYADSAAATSAKKTIEEAYTKKYTDLDLYRDPFNSTYSVSGNSLTVTHFAESKKISFENMSILDIPQTNGTNPDIDAIDSALSDKGYTCKAKSAD